MVQTSTTGASTTETRRTTIQASLTSKRLDTTTTPTHCDQDVTLSTSGRRPYVKLCNMPTRRLCHSDNLLTFLSSLPQSRLKSRTTQLVDQAQRKIALGLQLPTIATGTNLPDQKLSSKQSITLRRYTILTRIQKEDKSTLFSVRRQTPVYWPVRPEKPEPPHGKARHMR